MSVLGEILEHKREEVAVLKERVAINELKEREPFALPRLSLERALRSRTTSIIAEIKKASPSRGIIREQFDPLSIAREYVANGATALSVLTDEKYFQGNVKYIEAMRNDVPIPILRKDFVVDSYQLYEAKAYGADAVLLIAAALGSSHLHELHDEAVQLDMECLVEVHSEQEVESLNFDKVKLVGINNRDLATFKTDLQTSVRLKKFVPTHVHVVSESAIHEAADIRLLIESGITSFLIGEKFMRSASPGLALREMLLSVESGRQ